MRGLHHIGIYLKTGKKYPKTPLKPDCTKDNAAAAEIY